MRHPAKKAPRINAICKTMVAGSGRARAKNARRYCTSNDEKLFPGLRRFSAEPSAPLWFGFLGWRGRRFRRLRRWLFRLNNFFFFWLGRLFFRRFLFGRWCCIDPFDKRHRRGVALALAQPNDASVAAVTVSRSRRDLGEQFLYGILLPQCPQGSPPRMQRAVFAQRHHFFGERSNRLRFGKGRLDALMFDQAAHLVGEQSFAVLRRPAKLDCLFSMSHETTNVTSRLARLLGLRHQRSPTRPQDPDRISSQDSTQGVAVCP